MLTALKTFQARRVVYAAGSSIPAETFTPDEITALQADGIIAVSEAPAPEGETEPKAGKKK